MRGHQDRRLALAGHLLNSRRWSKPTGDNQATDVARQGRTLRILPVADNDQVARRNVFQHRFRAHGADQHIAAHFGARIADHHCSFQRLRNITQGGGSVMQVLHLKLAQVAAGQVTLCHNAHGPFFVVDNR